MATQERFFCGRPMQHCTAPRSKVVTAWKSFTGDPTPRNAACFGSAKGSLYVAGGAVNNEAVGVTESFKVSKNAWTTQAPMPQAVGIPGSAVYKNVLYCIGGANNGNLFNNTVYGYVQIYQP